MQSYKIISMWLVLIAVFGVFGCKQASEKVIEVDPKVKKIVLPPGFVAEHIYSPSDNELGSWVAMTFDNKGRMITSDQFGALYRIELPPIGADSTVKPTVQKLDFPKEDGAEKDTTKNKVGMGYAQGLLWAHNSLYVMVNHKADDEFKKGSGLYRLQDTNNDDQFDKITQLKSLDGSGEHGPHSIVLGPDKKSLYVVAGNFTDLPKMDSYRLPPNGQRDNLFPIILDPQGHDADSHDKGGWIAKTDSIGEKWELISAGFRNPFDLAFNDAGELFTYDSDMEWDFGMPWYRPTRICHVTSGAEFGWRKGNDKWSPNYPDNLPAILDIGQGSPTNIMFAHNARFPEKYSNSLLAFDWSFGIIYAVQMKPEGASYQAKAEEFISGSPLALTDGEIGPDGALYFLSGGRKLESDLYRVYYKDYQKIDLKERKVEKETEKQRLRKMLEGYHTLSAEGAAEKLWPYLSYQDRFIRYAARIAIEHQPVNTWKDLALQERNVTALTEAMIALARNGNSSLRSAMLRKMSTVDMETLPLVMKQNLLRAYELVIARMGVPKKEDKEQLVNHLAGFYPSHVNALDQQLSKILVKIGAANVVEKTVPLLFTVKDDTTNQRTVTQSSDLILRNPQYGLDIANMLAKMPPAQQIYFATVLSLAREGWTSELQEHYFKWFYDAFGYKGGNSYIGFIDKARKMALERVSKSQYAYYNKLSGDSLLSSTGTSLAFEGEGPKGPGKNWKMEDALPIVEKDSGDRDFKRGAMLFAAIRCGSCHTVRGEGGSIGPDLTQLGTRFTAKDILESIIEPNKVISDQYASTVFMLKDGSSMLGRLKNEDETTYYISQNPYAPQVLKEIPKKSITNTKTAEVSMMPPGTINVINADELKDLMAYLRSGGNKDSELFKPKKSK
jgi:putative heme-binding domain-containing protein